VENRAGMDTVRTLRPGDGAFPELLARIPGAPASLRLRGRLGTPVARVALVGSRDPDEYGRDMARRLARGLVRAGVSVVSGGARGIDAEAHEGALEAGGHTVSVLASGVDQPSPLGNLDLFDRILDAGGALLSEYDDGTLARGFRFVERNRIVSVCAKRSAFARLLSASGARPAAR